MSRTLLRRPLVNTVLTAPSRMRGDGCTYSDVIICIHDGHRVHRVDCLTQVTQVCMGWHIQYVQYASNVLLDTGVHGVAHTVCKYYLTNLTHVCMG